MVTKRVDVAARRVRQMMAEITNRTIIRGYRAAEKKVGKSRVQIWRDIAAGKFPPPLELGPNSVGWFEDELDAWLASRPRRTYGSPQPEAP